MYEDLPKTRSELRAFLPSLLRQARGRGGGATEIHITEDVCYHVSAFCSCDPELFYHDAIYEVWIHDDSAYTETPEIPRSLQ